MKQHRWGDSLKNIIRFLLALSTIFFIINFLPIEANASSFREVKTINLKDGVALKKAASTDADTVTHIPYKAFVVQYNTPDSDWVHVQYGDQKGFVEKTALSAPPYTIKIASSKGGVVVKDSPNVKSPTQTYLQYKMVVKDFGSVGGNWSFVQYGNIIGYVNSKFIGDVKPYPKVYIYNGANSLYNIASFSGEKTPFLAKRGDVVQVYSEIAGFSYVSFGNQQGYIYSSELVDKTVWANQQKLTSFQSLVPKKHSTATMQINGKTYKQLQLKKTGNTYSYYEKNNNKPILSITYNTNELAIKGINLLLDLKLPAPLEQINDTKTLIVPNTSRDAYLQLLTTKDSLKTPLGILNNVTTLYISYSFVEDAMSTDIYKLYFSKNYGLVKITGGVDLGPSTHNNIVFELQTLK